MRIEALGHPGEQTDILGSLDLAQQEFEFEQKPMERQLIILSDFIEEDGAMPAETPTAMAMTGSATAGARR